MAIVLDINLLCNKTIDPNDIMKLLNKYKVTVESIDSIDNWMWENEKKLESFKQTKDILDAKHIIVIKLRKSHVKDMGVYIEKVNNQYLYTLWINTEGYPVLDSERVTVDNSKFYGEIIQSFLEIREEAADFFELVGVGLETDFYYEKELMDIIHNSKNITLWIVNNSLKSGVQLDNFNVDRINGMCVLQKK